MNGTRMQVDRNQRGLNDSVLDDFTAAEFQAGPIPHRIVRRYWSNDQGLNGEDTNYYPNTGGMTYMMHQRIPRTPRASAGRYGVPTINETLAVPSSPVGSAV
jgi:hypothetical protein